MNVKNYTIQQLERKILGLTADKGQLLLKRKAINENIKFKNECINYWIGILKVNNHERK